MSEAACYMADGQELYAIVPPNEKGRVTVYPSDITENGEYADDKSHPLFEGKPGEACSCYVAISVRSIPMYWFR